MQVITLPATRKTRFLSIKDDDEYFDFCMQNPNLRIERTAEGIVEIMPPVSLDSGHQEMKVGTYLTIWAERDGRGETFSPSTAFILPSGAVYAADASWVSNDRLAKLPAAERSRFPHLCPEFVVEVRSSTDRLIRLKAKMQDWIDNGANLAWLIDGKRHAVTIYRPERHPEELINPEFVQGEGPVKGFRLNMSRVWGAS